MSGRQSQLTALRRVNTDLYRQLNELRAAKDAEISALDAEIAELKAQLKGVKDVLHREIGSDAALIEIERLLLTPRLPTEEKPDIHDGCRGATNPCGHVGVRFGISSHTCSVCGVQL